MLKSPLRSGRNANESTVTQNMKKKDNLENVKKVYFLLLKMALQKMT